MQMPNQRINSGKKTIRGVAFARVGVDSAGRAHFVLSEAPVSFGRFARYFRDEARTPNALYLDGSVSALWDPANRRRDESVPLGPLIVVTNKATAKP